jgi:hypothetical protein
MLFSDLTLSRRLERAEGRACVQFGEARRRLFPDSGVIRRPRHYVTERFRRRDFGHLDIQLTIDDPKAYIKPWTVNLLPMEFDGDNELLEDVCNENEKDLKHIVGK